MKKTLKIILAALLSIAMLMTVAAAATESDTIDTHHDEHALDVFADAPAFDSWKYQGLNCAVNNGTMTGHDNKIRPDDSLTRAEMVTMMVRVLGAHATKAEIEHYVDVVSGQWYYEALQSGVATKIINGSGNKMMPNSPITREQTFTILARTFLFSSNNDATTDFVDNSKVSSWAKNATNALIDAEVVRGDNTKTLRPQDNVTRAEFAVMLDRVACLFANTGASYSGKTVSGSVIVNDATADLSGATIEGDLIITDAVGAANIDLSNVTVTGRIVIRGGDVNLNEGTTAAQVVVGNPTGASKITAAEGVEVPKVVVAENANDVEIDVPAKEVVIDSSKNEVVINKDAEKVTVNGSDNTLKVNSGAKVDNVTVNGDSSKVTGSGNVANATVNGESSKVETPNTNVTDNSSSTKPDSGKNEGQGPNSKPSDSANSGSLPGTTKPSTPTTPSIEIDVQNTYVTYQIGNSQEEKVFGMFYEYNDDPVPEIVFDFGADLVTREGLNVHSADYVEVKLGELQIVAKDITEAPLTLTGFATETEFTTDVEYGLVDLLQAMIDATNNNAFASKYLGVDNLTGDDYNLFKLASVLDEACNIYVNDQSPDKWVQGIFNERGIVCDYAEADGTPNLNSAKATFTAKIGNAPIKITMIIPVAGELFN